MSHKTGKRVLTASTTLAMAAVGLAAMPLTAHATAVVNLVNACGGGSAAAGLDYVELPAKTGTYTIMDGGTSTSNTDTATAITPAAGSSSLSADGTTVRYYLQSSAYGTADANNVKSLINTFAIYDSLGTKITPTAVGGAVTDAKCAVQSVPAITSDVSKKTITVTKGMGLTWTLTLAKSAGAAGTTVVTTNGENFSNSTNSAANAASTGGDTVVTLGWKPTDGPTATQTLTANPSAAVDKITVTAAPAAGYTGVTVSRDFYFDNQAQLTYTAPVKHDLDGKDSDSISVTPIDGVTWYYTTDTNAVVGDLALDVPSGDYKATGHGWTAVDTSSGQTTISRGSLAAGSNIRVAAATKKGYKFGNTGTNVDAAFGDANGDHVRTFTTTFADTTEVTSIPAPTFSDGPGSEDYYTLPNVPGVKWVIKGDVGYPGPNYRTVLPTEAGLLNTPIRLTSNTANSPYSVTIEAQAASGDYTLKSGLTTTWTKEFDSRTAITPGAPSFLDMTGLVDDKVTFPNLSVGITKYQYLAEAKGTTSGTFKDVDGGWYGKTVNVLGSSGLTNDTAKTQITIKAVLSDGMIPATGADGKAVPTQWTYFFDNLVNIVPQWPTVSDVTGTANDTITFPVDTKVTYTMIQNGISRTIPVSDLGKPLAASGKVTVKVAAATGYAIQTDASGKPPADWTYTFSTFDPITPQAPTANEHPGVDRDSYSLPAQTGVVWYVDGAKTDAGTYNTGGKLAIKVVAQPADGYVFVAGAKTEWPLTFSPDTDVVPKNVKVGNEVDDTADVPTSHVTWSADGAASYTVTYQKLLLNGQRGPELPWLTDTDKTSADFRANPGDKYYVRVVATGTDGSDADVVETLIEFPGGDLKDITTGVGTFNNAWQQLTNLKATQNLPYYKDTAALGYTNAQWTVTLPAGTAAFDLFATVHDLGAKGKIQVNGQNWADFSTSSTDWGKVADPYSYPVRTVQGWDTSKPVTIKVIATDAGTKYLALDAYKAY